MLTILCKHLTRAALCLGMLVLCAVPSQSTPQKQKLPPVSSFPVPSVANQLLYLQRDPNTNTIVYGLNYKNNKLDEDNPVHVFWVKFAEKSQEEELTFIQRKFAYGINTKRIANDSYEMHIVSYKKCTLQLMKGADNEYHIYTAINNKQAILKRIFIRINGGTLFFPNVEYIELTGTDAATGSELQQRFKP